MKITEEQMTEWIRTQPTSTAIMFKIAICLNNTIDEAREKICESIDVFINARVASDKVIEGVLKDIRASIDDVSKQH